MELLISYIQVVQEVVSILRCVMHSEFSTCVLNMKLPHICLNEHFTPIIVILLESPQK